MRLTDVGHLGEGRVRVDGELVVWDAVRREDLARVRVEDERRDLGRGCEGVEACAGGGVPEVNRAVRRAAARGEETRVPGTPREGLEKSRDENGPGLKKDATHLDRGGVVRL